MTSNTLVLLGAVGLVVALLALGIARARRSKRRARVVEQPNSHYTSQLVQATEKRTRWHDIDLASLHEVNRQEVQQLLARLDATSVDALRPQERVFLDRMADIAGPPARADRPARDSSTTPELRHRPA